MAKRYSYVAIRNKALSIVQLIVIHMEYLGFDEALCVFMAWSELSMTWNS